MDPLIHLHGHTTFSFQDGFGTPSQLAKRLQQLGHGACACTDHGNVFAHVPYQKAMRAAGIKPIFGCEFYVVENYTSRTREQSEIGANAFPHVTVLARTQEGYRNLLKLSRLSWEEGFYYKPRIDWDLLGKYQSGLVVLSGCPGGWPSRLILGKDDSAAFDWIQRMRHRFEHFYIELDPAPSMGELSTRATDALCRISRELKIPAVVTADSHFPNPEDHRAQDLMLCVGIGKRIKEVDALEASGKKIFRTPEYQYYCSGEELFHRCVKVCPQEQPSFFWDAICRTREIAALCEVEIPKAKPIAFPDIPDGQNANDVLLTWIQEGFVKRAPHFTDAPETYWQRAMYEYQILCNKGFADYILAVADVCKWMKDQNVLVMLRGSAGGSLVLWLLGASETDPIRHGLSFERFYDHTRQDPPDVDIDFERLQRDKAIQYVYSKYGPTHCSQIAALSKLKAKAAVQDVCFALGIPRSEFAPLSDALDSQDEDVDKQLHSVTDPKALTVLEKYPVIGELVPKLIGQYRQQSVHAAGVLVSSEPLENFIGIVLGAEKQPVAAVDKKGAAELGLLKFDFLSVNGLDIVGTAVRSLGLPISWLFTLPLDDSKALALANNGYLAGIFQLDGGAASRVCRQIGIDTFEDVVAASGLCRPGPAEWVDIYKENKHDWHKLAMYLGQLHPVAQKILTPTFGILLYQEQVMALARELAQMEWEHVHKLRKGVQDKLGLDPQTGPAWKAEWHERFLVHCAAAGVKTEEAEFWWHSVESHGGYSFNKSHCTTYGLIGYWMLYLKAHHPAAFYGAYLKLDNDAVTMKKLIAEFKSMGGEVRLLDPIFSQETFSSPEPNVLVGGWQNLKGIGPVMAAKINAEAPFTGWEDLWTRTVETKSGKPALLLGAIGEKMRDAGFGGTLDPQKVIAFAPWFPVPCTGEFEAAAKKQYGLVNLGDLPKEPSAEDIDVAGYVTVTAFENDKIIFVLEDETRAIVVRIARKGVQSIGVKFRDIQVSDYIAVRGWWTGDVLFAKDYVLVKRREQYVKPVKPKSTRTASRSRKSGDGQQQPSTSVPAGFAGLSSNQPRGLLGVPPVVDAPATGPTD